jgi:hypothetical protein
MFSIIQLLLEEKIASFQIANNAVGSAEKKSKTDEKETSTTIEEKGSN